MRFNTQPHGGGCLHKPILPLTNHRFQHTAARRRLLFPTAELTIGGEFQHTAARRRLLGGLAENKVTEGVSTHSRTEAAAPLAPDLTRIVGVSTHSRTEAAAITLTVTLCFLLSFNTQPHGGGCHYDKDELWLIARFNTQPHGGGCDGFKTTREQEQVSTHSRTEAAAWK